MPESPSGEALPPYAPPVHTRKQRADSFASSTDDINIDLEKGFRPLSTLVMSPPLSSHFHDSMFASSSDAELSPRPTEFAHDSSRDTQYTDTESEAHISISDEHPASTPPTPVPGSRQGQGHPMRALSPNPVPSYHRPFSPPVAWPAPTASVPRKGSAGSISILVHTESRTF